LANRYKPDIQVFAGKEKNVRITIFEMDGDQRAGVNQKQDN